MARFKRVQKTIKTTLGKLQLGGTMLSIAMISMVMLSGLVGTKAWADGHGAKFDNLFGTLVGTLVSSDGELTLPQNFIAEWRHINSSALMNEQGDGVVTIHAIYTQPGVVEHYNQHGDFPDGAVLIKEIRFAKMGAQVTGNLARSDGVDIWFMMVRDHNNRFDGHKHWANGWGWAQFTPDAPTTNSSEGFEAGCRACHEPAAETGWVYTELYPALKP